MRILLDTHAFLWIAGDWKGIRAAARRILQDPKTSLFLSAASVWEIAIKTGLGRLTLPTTPLVFVPRRVADFGISLIDVSAQHALAVYALAPHHADPFDRIIIAQAQLEELTVATRDRSYRSYDVETVAV